MKIRSWLPALGLVLAVTACGSSGSGADQSSSAPTSPVTASPSVKGVESLGAASSTASTPAASGPAVASPDGDFTVVLPTGWRQDTAVAQQIKAVAAYFGPTRNAFASNVNVVREDLPAGLDVESYRAKSLAGLRAAIAITDLTPSTKLSVDGEDALEYSFTDTQQGRKLIQRQTVVLHGSSAYTITYTSTTVDFAASSAAAHSIVGSLRWRS
ncbi:DcrB-related protein [uncultured Jatrophihabitans sp.]|uniref:DcrB-related protein n=1 Tax=uncultured Jatrophihabitans sp. TaxID=1610747 RepID=UPI0035C9C9F7